MNANNGTRNTIECNGAMPVEAIIGVPAEVHAAGAPDRRLAAVDLKTRPRNARGDREASGYAFSIPTVDGAPLAKTSLAAAIARIAETRPVLAAELAHDYDHKLQEARRAYVQTRLEEEEWLRGYNARAAQVNQEIDSEQARLTDERDPATRADRETVLEMDAPLARAHAEAAARCAVAGGAYDAANPTEACVLRHERRPLEVLAGEEGLPWTPADKQARMSAGGALIGTLLTGIMAGISAGILFHLLHADRLTADRTLLAVMVVGGVSAAWLGKSALKLSAREASQRFWLGRPVGSWAPFTLIMAAVGFTILAVDAYVEREGLLANARMQEMVMSLSGGHR